MAFQTVDQWKNKITQWGKKYPAAAFRAYHKAAPGLQRMIRNDYLSGQVLGVVSGRLKASIRPDITKTRRKASFQIGTNVTSPKGFPYGTYWFNRGRDFLRPAIRRDLPRIAKMVLDEVMQAYPGGTKT